jgi:hypothetical protein
MLDAKGFLSASLERRRLSCSRQETIPRHLPEARSKRTEAGEPSEGAQGVEWSRIRRGPQKSH